MNLANLKMRRQQSIWDRFKILKANAYSKVRMFAKALGSTDNNVTRTLLDTNIKRDGGLFESGESFELFGFRAIYNFGISDADMQKLMNRAIVRFIISGDTILEIPLYMIPQGCGLVSGSTTASVNAPLNGDPAINNYFKLVEPIVIPEAIAFSVEIEFPETLAADTLSADCYLTIMMEGNLINGAIKKG